MGEFDGEEIYRMAQIQDGIIIDNTEFNIYYNPTTNYMYVIPVSEQRNGELINNK